MKHRSTYPEWWGVWHNEDGEFLLLQCDDNDLCLQFLADMLHPEHLEMRRVTSVRCEDA